MAKDKATETQVSKDLKEVVFERRQNYNTQYKRTRPIGMHFTKSTMTQQQFAYETDLNNIVDRNMQFKDPAFLTKLQLMHRKGEQVQPIYGDFSNVPDYKNAQDTLISAREQFDSLPSKIRKRFDNNPLKLLEFVNDESNYDEGVSLGIYKPRPSVNTPDAVNPENPQGSSVSAGSDVVSESSAQALT